MPLQTRRMSFQRQVPYYLLLGVAGDDAKENLPVAVLLDPKSEGAEVVVVVPLSIIVAVVVVVLLESSPHLESEGDVLSLYAVTLYLAQPVEITPSGATATVQLVTTGWSSLLFCVQFLPFFSFDKL